MMGDMEDGMVHREDILAEDILEEEETLDE